MGGEEEQLMGDSSSCLFQRRIEFHPARKPFLGFTNNPQFHLETLNPSSNASSSAAANPKKKDDLFKQQRGGLDPELSFQITTTVRRIGAGLENLGNTCFLNSVLQCLTYTEPFAAYLQTANHKSSCHTSGFCALCSIQNHVKRALHSTGRILAPKDLVMNLRCISRNFRNARQEDAHEYMVNLLESMHKCCLPSGVPSESPSAYEKSLVHKIFGGRLRSQVKCMQCSHCSNTFDPFLDLSLEIVKADTLLKALTHFTAVEQLDGGERQYQCQRCRKKVKALKQLTVNKAPYVLSVHLKRFSSHVPGQKINKKVEFGPTLDLKPFVSGFNEGDLNYTLYGVLVHAGWSTHSGHYYCFVRTSSGLWHSLDDNRVIQVSEKTVLQQKAYMLFYVRDRKIAASKRQMDSRPVLYSKPVESQYPRVQVEAVGNGPIAKVIPISESLKLKTTNSSPKCDFKELTSLVPPSSDIDKSKGTNDDNAAPVKLSNPSEAETIQMEKVLKPKKKVRNPNMGIGSQLLRKASLLQKRKRRRGFGKKDPSSDMVEPPPSTSERKRTRSDPLPNHSTKRPKNTDIRESNAPPPPPSEEKSSSNTLQVKKNLLESGKSLEFTIPIWDGFKDSQSVSIGYVPDEWDEEYDRGKIKKIRNRNKEDSRFGESKNPFQEIATKIRKEKFNRFSK